MTRWIPTAAIAILLAAASAYAQPAGYIEVPKIRGLPTERLGCFADEGLYDEHKLKLLAVKPNCANLRDLKFNFEKESVVFWRAASDCHMQVAIRIFRVDAEKKYKFLLNNIYGGCRAGGSRSGWTVFEKLPPGYTFEMHEIRVDRIHGPIRDDGFAFPQPPSVVKHEPLEVQEIDTNGCLPMTGTSQWVIQTNERLQSAVEGDVVKAGCIAHFAKLSIDFNKYTLAGYSFSSGHCDRPPDLRLAAVKETSSESRENRFLLTATYKSAGNDYCKVWTTYAVWVLVPKLPSGYGFGFEAKANDR